MESIGSQINSYFNNLKNKIKDEKRHWEYELIRSYVFSWELEKMRRAANILDKLYVNQNKLNYFPKNN